MKTWTLHVVLLSSLVTGVFAPLAHAGGPPGSSAPTGSAAPLVPVPQSTTSARSFTDQMSCEACHTTTAWRANGISSDGKKFDHATTGFPLTGEHLKTPCAACHSATRSIKRVCASCHDDFHRGRLSQSCDTCHSPAGWKLTRPIEIHRMTRFPLTGMHVLADCTECHQRASEQRWTDTPTDCYACHQKEYRRPDIFPIHVGTATTAPFPRDCSLCHRAVAWVPAAPLGSQPAALGSALATAPPNHDARFPISFGVHRMAACTDCHASQAAPRMVRCIGCHAHDPVRLMQQHRQPMASDGASCLTCHPGGIRR